MHEQYSKSGRAFVTTTVAAIGFATAVAASQTRVDSQPPSKPAAATSPPAATIAVADPGWPRTHTTRAGGRIQIYQPQIASWEGQQRLVAYIAVSHQAGGTDKTVVGTLKVEADTTVALDQRLVRFDAFRITETNFGSQPRDRARAIVADVERALGEFERVMSLDRLLAGLDRSQIRPRNVEGVKADPPRIFYSTRPAVLVSFDGDPIWNPIPGTELRFAINTNWDVFDHPASNSLFLRIQDTWLKAGAMAGPWTPAGTLPPSFAKLPADENWREVRASLPGRRMANRDVPVVFASTSPAELILVHGAPDYSLVSQSSDLLWVNNTASDVFRLGKSGPVYYLVAGRWFSAPDFGGPWTFATPALPPDFTMIGLEHPRARVLASVPGTRQAAEAVVLAQIPRTARVSREQVKAPEVQYQGTPQFQPIEKTTVLRAVNTDKDVIKVGDRYYLCFQGVWFLAATPLGPWAVAAAVPPQVYAIPASSPAHHVTYVTIVDTDADWVVFGTGAGYSGLTIAWGCAVWGTGWYYPPYVYYGAVSPIYYPYYPTYGYSAWYDPWTATYARGGVAYGPYGGVGATARYNPSTGTYARAGMAWGPYGAQGAAEAYNPRTGTYGATRQGAGPYGSWGSSYVQRGDDWAHTSRVTNNVTGTTSRVTRTDDGGAVSRSGPGGSGFVAAGDEGIYAGRDGNVYRRAEDGGWQKYENGGWGDSQHPRDNAAANARERAGGPAGEGGGLDRSTLGQLDRDRSARLEGGQRARERAAPGGGRASAGAARPRGGRPGGGRRR